MRIVNSVLGDATGGRWQVVCQYSRLLLQAGHRVCMLLEQRNRFDPADIPDAVELLRVSNRGHYDYPAGWRTRAPLRAFAPEIAIAHCSRSVALLRRALPPGVPLVAVSHSNKITRLLPADAWIALTSHIASAIRRQQPSPAGPCYVIPNMIDIGSQDLAPRRAFSQPPVIGALGRFDRVKGFDVFLAALAELKTQGVAFRARLAGAGIEYAALAAQRQQLGLERQLELRGWVDDVGEFFAGLDVLCVPARSDAFGLTPLQAAVAGVPLVLSRASGHLEMFSEDREALFFAIDDPADTARQLRTISEQQGQANTLRDAAYRRVVTQYASPVVTEKILQAIENISSTSKIS